MKLTLHVRSNKNDLYATKKVLPKAGGTLNFISCK